MSYGGTETSTRLGSPIELYKFVVDLQEYLYTSQEEDIIDGLDTYTAIPLQRSGLNFEGESNKSNINISMPRNQEIALLFIDQPPAVTVVLYIYRYHQTDSIANKALVWSGRILDAMWSDNIVTFNCENIYSSINRKGLRRTHGPSCPYTLYKEGCDLDHTVYELTTTIESMSGLQITSAAIGNQSDGYYTGGYMSYTVNPNPTQYRAITDHTGDTITINYSVPDMAVGSEIKVYPGCAHNLDDCFDKFSNGINYGGFAYMPLVNPFNGTTLF